MTTMLTQNAGKIWAGLSAASFIGAAGSKYIEINKKSFCVWPDQIKLPTIENAYKTLAPLSTMFGLLAASSGRSMHLAARVIGTGVATVVCHTLVKTYMSNPDKLFGK